MKKLLYEPKKLENLSKIIENKLKEKKASLFSKFLQIFK